MLSEHNETTSLGLLWYDNNNPMSTAATAGDNLSPSLAASDDSLRPFMEAVTLAAVLLLLILFCVIGNLFVIIAIACERDLRGRPQYYLIFSLAVADLIQSIGSMGQDSRIYLLETAALLS
ncbi:hypothetical protein COOONC_11973 [Cooperia oncophora]